MFDFDANYNWANSPQLQQYRYLHFATHGFVDSINPELSGIVLSLFDKQGTAMLMQEFYKQLLQQGKSPTTALPAAQLNMWQQQKWRNPYYWSAFIFVGEWQ